ncbi:S41 family peptidase [Caldanaerobius polysaccharolyticus]|uniref:S41 family peptidase n=1 Tax=Caldanaerobius polysaccharolyticus TaxID=44256 RepID=UPI00047EFC18|nr:S41 family peptidase [Caldanaerobius polysaccharolyticus]
MKKYLLSILVIAFMIMSTVTGYAQANTSAAASGYGDSISFINDVMGFIQDYYPYDVSSDKLTVAAVKGMLQSLDPYSDYFTPDELIQFENQTSGTYTGIGIQIEQKGTYISVISVFKDSPAEKAGMKVGDYIVSIDGKSVSGMTLDQAAALLRGQEGTKVKLMVQRPGVNSLLTFEVIRSKIKINPVEYKVVDGVGYIRLSEFNENAGEFMGKAVQDLKARGIKAVVLDLRDNPGGLLSSAVDVARYFVPSGKIVSVVYKNAPSEVYYSYLTSVPFKLAVLINGNTASAAEILAGAIQDRKAGILIGTRTFGKGVVQTVISLDDGSAIKMTIARYLTPSGRDINGKGISPNIQVADPVVKEPLDTSWLAPFDYAPLKVGDRKLAVYALEQRLKVLGYYSGNMSDEFTLNTLKALNSYQKAKGIKATNVLDKNTYDAINKDIEALKNPVLVDNQLQYAVKYLKSLLRISK